MIWARGTMMSGFLNSPTPSRLASITRRRDSAGCLRSLSSITSSRLSRIAALEGSPPRRRCIRCFRSGCGPADVSLILPPHKDWLCRGGREFRFPLSPSPWRRGRGSSWPASMYRPRTTRWVRVIGQAREPGFAACDAQGQRDIAAIAVKVGGVQERQDIGRLVLGAEIPVEGLEPGVAGQKDGERGKHRETSQPFRPPPRRASAGAKAPGLSPARYRPPLPECLVQP